MYSSTNNFQAVGIVTKKSNGFALKQVIKYMVKKSFVVIKTYVSYRKENFIPLQDLSKWKEKTTKYSL